MYNISEMRYKLWGDVGMVYEAGLKPAGQFALEGSSPSRPTTINIAVSKIAG